MKVLHALAAAVFSALVSLASAADGLISLKSPHSAKATMDKLEGLVHISQIREERIEKLKDVLKVGEEVNARVIKIDPQERRIGLSIKAANYSMEQLEVEKRMFEDALKPGEAIVDLEHAFDQAQEEKEQ